MENASKALLIAAAVLIVVLIITVGIRIVSSADGIKGAATDTGKAIYDKTADATSIAIGEINGGQVNNNKTPISKTDSYVGYYADVDGDGSVDGVIYADLSIGAKGEWGMIAGFSGAYNINKIENVKDYYISQTEYPKGKFGNKGVIRVLEETGNDRFYVMALEDVNNSNGYYYKEACEQENGDWKLPTKEKWLIFGGELRITRENYVDKGLKSDYWSSSTRDKYSVWYAFFLNGEVYFGSQGIKRSVRLTTNF